MSRLRLGAWEAAAMVAAVAVAVAVAVVVAVAVAVAVPVAMANSPVPRGVSSIHPERLAPEIISKSFPIKPVAACRAVSVLRHLTAQRRQNDGANKCLLSYNSASWFCEGRGELRRKCGEL